MLKARCIANSNERIGSYRSAKRVARVDLFQLETFLAVAEERSFSRAAARLHRTQPAVSQVIAKLEAELGETLLERTSPGGILTDAGEVLQEYAQKMLNLRKDAGAALEDLRSLHAGRLDLAANEYTCLYLLPVLDAFRREHPRIKVAVQRTLASRIADEVLSHSVEMGVVSFRPADPQVVSTVVYRDELVCVMSPGHALAKAKKASIARLGRETFVAHNVPSPLRQKVIAAFQKHKTPLHMEVELPSLEAIKRFVQRGNGVALVPKLTVESELESGELVAVQVPELQVERKLRLVHRKQAALSHAAREFLRVVKAHAAEHGDPFCFVLEKN
jgi:DNA-binding transcriptional LysR family regulator